MTAATFMIARVSCLLSPFIIHPFVTLGGKVSSWVKYSAVQASFVLWSERVREWVSEWMSELDCTCWCTFMCTYVHLYILNLSLVRKGKESSEKKEERQSTHTQTLFLSPLSLCLSLCNISMEMILQRNLPTQFTQLVIKAFEHLKESSSSSSSSCESSNFESLSV